ncbi:GmrSD restriction endonuclease domain-containing protein [Demequina gelatinilytica]|uniref:GmrSD restriction endonuclease domain-containing protein n=1 Tax=Demequina gelatinilytica TaxID=1638980 RepID=UPI0009E346C5|nr:DUF1524 domain-containing protein [Demequina gelatinilytica]
MILRSSRIAILASIAVLLAACAGAGETSDLRGVPTATAAASPSPDVSEASPASSVSATPTPTGSALEAALALAVEAPASTDGYSREEFGPAWADVDHNGCDTRNDMLQLRLTAVALDGACIVLEGDLDDPYTGTVIHFERGGASEIDIDHMVALSAAWQTGAGEWEPAKRVALANDPLNLEPVDAGENRAKGDDDAAEWLPPNRSYRCEYVARQVAVKTKYGLWVTADERDAIVDVLEGCPDRLLPGPGDQPVLAEGVGDGPGDDAGSGGSASPSPSPSVAASTDPRFSSCAKAIAAGFGPYREGVDEEYGWYRDGDGDGTVCEG